MSLFNLSNLLSLNIEDIDVDYMDKDTFTKLKHLTFIYFKKFHYCMSYAPKIRKCIPLSDGMSSTSDLIDKLLLRISVWSISCITCLCNILDLWGRYTAKDENRVLNMIIKNLAVSDMLMGIYLFAIAIEDVKLRNNYKEEANTWMSSWSCTFLGALAMTSTEVSMFIMLLISVERYVVITAPFNYNRMTYRIAFISMVMIWVTGIIIALLPVIYWRSTTKFYGISGMCFPLHINEPYLIGWEYSAFVFLGLNLFGLMILGYVYVGMFVNIWKTRHNAGRTFAADDTELALRFFLIVLTDATCWAPIITLKIMAVKYPVPSHLHALLMIFILPVNSAINPLLYTFTMRNFRRRLIGCIDAKM